MLRRSAMMPPNPSSRTLPATALLALGAAGLGALAAFQPLYTILAVVVLIAIAVPSSFVARQPTEVAMVWLLLVLNVLDVLRWAQSEERLVVFGNARVPVTLLVLGGLIFSRGAQLFTEQSVRAAVPGLAYATWALLVSPWSSDPGDSAMRAVWLGMILVAIGGTLALWGDPFDLWERWLLGLSRTGLIFGSISLVTIALAFPWAVNTRWVGDRELSGYRAYFQNPNALGCLGAITILSSLGWLRSRVGRERPYAVYAAIAVGAFCVVSSASRGSTLSMLLAGLVFLLSRGRVQARLVQRVRTVFAALLLGAGVLVFSDAGDTIISRFSATEQSVEGGEEGRTSIWWNFGLAVLENPLTGVGFCQAVDETDRSSALALGAQRAHSMFVEFGTTVGLPGLFLFGWALFGAVFGIRSKYGVELQGSIGVVAAGLLPLCAFEARGSPGSDGTWPVWFLVMFGRSLAAHWPLASIRLAARARARAEAGLLL